uniref:ORF3 n=1 Tax=Monilinia barnavirus A TaxID=2592777 RepID=A0A7G3KIJ9_9VIRU|nr:ORF3 [Monilinia barnavirus A]
MVKGSVGERVAKRAAHYERLVADGKISRQEANRRERESRLSITGVSTPSASGPPSGGSKRKAVRSTGGSGRGGDMLFPSPSTMGETTLGPGEPGFNVSPWDERWWEHLSHFNNVSLVSMVCQVTCPLDIDDKSCRIAFGFSETKPPEGVTFARVAALKGAVVLRGEALEGRHTFVPPAGSPRILQKRGVRAMSEVNPRSLWFCALVERSSTFVGVIGVHCTASLLCGGGPVLTPTTSL